MDLTTVTVDLRLTVNGAYVPGLGWRLRVLGCVARLLRIPLEVGTD